MKLALFDIDGVLANDSHRVKFALERRYTEYFDPARMSKDKLWKQGQQAVAQAVADGWTIAYLTGRRQDRRQLTEDWLDAHGLPWGRLVMRTFSQIMPLANFKEEYIQKVVSSGVFTDVVLFDDDPEVIRFVQKQVGQAHAIHCTWHKKKKAMVKLATV